MNNNLTVVVRPEGVYYALSGKGLVCLTYPKTLTHLLAPRVYLSNLNGLARGSRLNASPDHERKEVRNG
jgi:hypothetical protein